MKVHLGGQGSCERWESMWHWRSMRGYYHLSFPAQHDLLTALAFPTSIQDNVKKVLL